MYAIDQQAARKADAQGAQIREIGKYVGEITQAVDIDTKKGGKGIALTFKANNGQKANLALYTKGANGDQYQGYDMLMAMMTCMGLRNIEPKPGTYVRYDYDQKKDITERGTIFPDLCKPIGVLLETEDYLKDDGSTGTRMVLKAVFQHNTELMASEIWDRKTQPERLAKAVLTLRHRPLKAPARAGQAGHATHTSGGSGFEDMDSDIPFADPMKSRAFCMAV